MVFSLFLALSVLLGAAYALPTDSVLTDFPSVVSAAIAMALPGTIRQRAHLQARLARFCGAADTDRSGAGDGLPDIWRTNHATACGWVLLRGPNPHTEPCQRIQARERHAIRAGRSKHHPGLRWQTIRRAACLQCVNHHNQRPDHPKLRGEQPK